MRRILPAVLFSLASFAVPGVADPNGPESVHPPVPDAPVGARSGFLFQTIQSCLPAAVDITGITTTPEGAQAGYAGSAIVIHEAGWLLTNAHVVGTGAITAHLHDGTAVACRLVARHPTEDLAVLKIECGRPLAPIRIGSNDGLQIGDPAIVIGNPNGLSHTVSTGIVSRLPAGYVQSGHIMTTAAVNGGNSGGPLISEHGELLGVITAKIGGEAMGLAIPVDRVRALFPEMLLDENVRGFRLGLVVDTKGEEARVLRVCEDSPASRAGLAVGDVIVRAAGIAVRHGLDFLLAAGDRKPDDALPLEVRRGEQSLTASLAPEALPLRPAEAGGDFVYGLAFEVYRNDGSWTVLPDFDKLAPAARGWTSAFTHKLPQAGTDRFGLRFAGWVEVPADGAWTFATVSDDGSRLWIGDTLVVDNDGLHAPTERRGTIRLAAGKHPIRVTHFEGSGGENLQVFWSGPKVDKQEIPAAALFVKR